MEVAIGPASRCERKSGSDRSHFRIKEPCRCECLPRSETKERMMSMELVASVALGSESSSDYQALSITNATVIDNIDQTGEMRVQVRIPWLPDANPWVRVAMPMAGPRRGIFFIPQVNDEVLLA